MLWIPLALLALALAAEVGARAYGFGSPLLYEVTAYGYRVKPGQRLRRLGNQLYYNRYGMRSEEIAPVPGPGILRVLCIGDSVTYGGAQTTQAETYPYLLEAELKRRGVSAEVLNASAGGWAPENEAGWLQANGTFGSQIVVIQWSTHDLFQPMAPSAIVGAHPQFPAEPPPLALQEVVFRYVLPRVLGRVRTDDPGVIEQPNTREGVARNLRLLGAMFARIRESGGQPIVLFTEQPNALEQEDELTRWAKAEFARVTQGASVRALRAKERFEAAGGTGLFRDPDHPTPAGNRILAELLADAIGEGPVHTPE